MDGDDADKDPLFDEAVKTVCQYDRASASLLQRRLKVGYARAARIIDELEVAGVIGAGEGSKPREVLVRNANEFLNGGAGGGEDDPTGNPQPQQY
jgi:S-DNA-T family DNA segregation ATPase FtsK/SpoIIIE